MSNTVCVLAGKIMLKNGIKIIIYDEATIVNRFYRTPAIMALSVISLPKKPVSTVSTDSCKELKNFASAGLPYWAGINF